MISNLCSNIFLAEKYFLGRREMLRPGEWCRDAAASTAVEMRRMQAGPLQRLGHCMPVSSPAVTSPLQHINQEYCSENIKILNINLIQIQMSRYR